MSTHSSGPGPGSMQIKGQTQKHRPVGDPCVWEPKEGLIRQQRLRAWGCLFPRQTWVMPQLSVHAKLFHLPAGPHPGP